jgi:hypothetical protein
MTFISYKYKRTGGKEKAPKTDLKGCFLWFIAFVIIIGVIAILAYLIDK